MSLHCWMQRNFWCGINSNCAKLRIFVSLEYLKLFPRVRYQHRTNSQALLFTNHYLLRGMLPVNWCFTSRNCGKFPKSSIPKYLLVSPINERWFFRSDELHNSANTWIRKLQTIYRPSIHSDCYCLPNTASDQYGQHLSHFQICRQIVDSWAIHGTTGRYCL